ncbi:MAG: hypothetical protein LBM93_11895, partial [Oscillospiraceae bacterium]|nr:hypothetical protein [Oscillospiraceae bacterium]
SIYFSELKNSEGTTPDDVYNYIEKNNYNKFADLLLELYKSSDIHHRINEVWENNKNENKDIKQLAILAIMKFVMQINLEFNEMLDLLELDYAILSKYNSELIKEFFDVNADDDVKIRSSVIAKEILYNIIGLEDLITTMTELVKQAGERCQINIKYGEFIKNLVSHSHFYNFKNKPEAGCLILKFYNDIRNVESCKDNHFFWVQYASVCIDLCEFQVANTCLDNAYNMSKSIPSFVPYQIDTTKARLKLEKILFNINSGDKYNSEEVIDIITEATKLLTKNIDHPDNNVNYVFRLALKFTDIFDNYKEDFDKRQKSIFTEKIVLLVKLMKTHQDKIGFNTKWIEKLEACKF